MTYGVHLWLPKATFPTLCMLTLIQIGKHRLKTIKKLLYLNLNNIAYQGFPFNLLQLVMKSKTHWSIGRIKFFKWAIPGLFIFVFSIQLTINVRYSYYAN